MTRASQSSPVGRTNGAVQTGPGSNWALNPKRQASQLGVCCRQTHTSHRPSQKLQHSSHLSPPPPSTRLAPGPCGRSRIFYRRRTQRCSLRPSRVLDLSSSWVGPPTALSRRITRGRAACWDWIRWARGQPCSRCVCRRGLNLVRRCARLDLNLVRWLSRLSFKATVDLTRSELRASVYSI